MEEIGLKEAETVDNLMIDHGVGVALEEAYEIKRVDSHYFNEAQVAFSSPRCDNAHNP
jgi:restriction endonuclease Mrr